MVRRKIAACGGYVISLVSNAKAPAGVSQRRPSIRCALGARPELTGVILHHLVLAQSSTHHRRCLGTSDRQLRSEKIRGRSRWLTVRSRSQTATMREGEPTAPMREGPAVCLS